MNLIYLSTHSRLFSHNTGEIAKHLQNICFKIAGDAISPSARFGEFPDPYKIKNYTPFDLNQNISTDTFSDITDMRAIQLAGIVEEKQLPVVVQWSGGIDSTVILSSIFKNFPIHLRKHVLVQMNNASYFENPSFFKTIIQPNFAYTDTLKYNWDECLLVHGQPADALWIIGGILSMSTEYPGCHAISLTQPDYLLSWLGARITPSTATWLYENLMHNGKTAGIELETYEDFFWWINFNLLYSQKCLSVANFGHKITQDTWKSFNENSVTWFNTNAYQLWSLSNRNNGIKFNGTLTSFKRPAKEYIYDVDKNRRYLEYKTKTHSGYLEKSTSHRVQAIFDNGNVLYF